MEKGKIEVDNDGITLAGSYFIAWSRIETEIKLVRWIHHLLGTVWVDGDIGMIHFIEAVCKKMGWNPYGL